MLTAQGTRTSKARVRRHLTRRILARVRDFYADKSGATAVIAAIMFPIVIGGMGLGAETGYWYLTQRKLQHAADLSGHAAGARLRAGDTKTQIDAAALNIATLSGLSTSIGTILVNAPPASGSKAEDTGSVEVILTEVHPRLFSSVFSAVPVTIKARAVTSIVSHSKACVLALSPTASGAITVSGTTDMNLAGCDVASNSNASDSFLMSGTAKLSADCVYAVGEAVTTSNLTLNGVTPPCTKVQTYAPVVRDPYASVVAPSLLGECHAEKVGSQTGQTLEPIENQPGGVKSMRFCDGLEAKGKVTFLPGLYIIQGHGLTINGEVTSIVDLADAPEGSKTGVTFYLESGSLKLTGNAKMTFHAPDEGPFSGLLFYGGRTNTTPQTITGTSGSTLQGAIYMPASEITFAGKSSTTTSCTQVIGLTLKFSGNSSLGASNCDNAGAIPIETKETVDIFE